MEVERVGVFSLPFCNVGKCEITTAVLRTSSNYTRKLSIRRLPGRGDWGGAGGFCISTKHRLKAKRNRPSLFLIGTEARSSWKQMKGFGTHLLINFNLHSNEPRQFRNYCWNKIGEINQSAGGDQKLVKLTWTPVFAEKDESKEGTVKLTSVKVAILSLKRWINLFLNGFYYSILPRRLSPSKCVFVCVVCISFK